MNSNFIEFSEFPGLGNPSSKLWFVGIEEACDISKNNLDEELRKCKNDGYFDNAVTDTKVWPIIAELIYDKFKDKHNLTSTEFRLKMFTKEYSYFFLTELFPIPRPNTKSWSSEYTEIFEYENADDDKYISDVRSYRYPIIYKKWMDAKPALTICFSLGYWYEYINLFLLGHSEYQRIGKNIILYPKENMLVTPFFMNTLSGEDRTIIKSFITKCEI
jgi:hypothetical protein